MATRGAGDIFDRADRDIAAGLDTAADSGNTADWGIVVGSDNTAGLDTAVDFGNIAGWGTAADSGSIVGWGIAAGSGNTADSDIVAGSDKTVCSGRCSAGEIFFSSADGCTVLWRRRGYR